jgi:hypothetical protein
VQLHAISCEDSLSMKALATVRKWDSQPRLHKFVVTYRQGGKRQVRYFKSEKLAKAFAAEKQVERS